MRVSDREYTAVMACVVFRSLGLLAVVGAAVAVGQSTSDPLVIKVIAEVEQSGKLVAADRVVSGDAVLYTLEVRNTGATSLQRPMVTYPIPQHMTYTPDSAVGPGTEVTYSVDAGRSFDAPENLKILEPGGHVRAATSVDYTHIRWRLKNAFKGNSVAFVRFRAQVK
jgi:uncharacterized repeat protein (TIGR01451 family)